jgi:tRNA (guanine37-N1)-methyltransferase
MPNQKLFQVITIFPDMIEHYATASILGRGQKAGVIKIEAINLRDFTTGAHRTVDDSPYGGGPGMVLKPDPIFKAVEKVRPEKSTTSRVILMDPRGTPFTQKKAHELKAFDQLIFIAGRYEGVDERVKQHLADESISIGPYVLSGGELGALVVIEAVARLVPGVLGKEESLAEESFSTEKILEYPQYTKPADFQGHKVPDILLSGDHAKIADWRKKQSGS